MPSRLIPSILVVVAGLAVSPGTLAQTAGRPEAAGARNAAPDLSGVWSPAPGSRRGFGDLKDIPPMLPGAEAKFKAAREGVTDPYEQGLDDLDPTSGVSINHCMPPGTPRVYNLPRPFEVVQVSGRVYILYEWDHTVRRIYTDGRKRPEGYPVTYMGLSIGKWEGDTLVVETTDLDEKTWLDGLGHPHSDALRVIERFRRVNQDTLEIEFVLDDPQSYTKSWGGKQVFQLRPTWEILEHEACDEYWEKVWGKSKYVTP